MCSFTACSPHINFYHARYRSNWKSRLYTYARKNVNILRFTQRRLYLLTTARMPRPVTGGRQPLNVDEYCFCYLIRNTLDIIPYLRAYDVQVRIHRRWGIIIEEEKYAKRPLCKGIEVHCTAPRHRNEKHSCNIINSKRIILYANIIKILILFPFCILKSAIKSSQDDCFIDRNLKWK